MKAPPRYAYAQARMRALKATLWDASTAAALRGRVAHRRAAAAPAFDRAGAFASLVRCYVTLMRAYPDPTAVIRSMLRIHQVENLKLLWRCTIRRRDVPEGTWLALGPLAAFAAEPAPSLPLLVEQLPRGEYRTIAAETFRSHRTDLFAAELAFDRWASAALDRAVEALPVAEYRTRDLVRARLRLRDLDLLRRGVRSFHLDPVFVARLTVRLSTECPHAALVRLAAWDEGREVPELPRVIRHAARGARDWHGIVEGAARAWMHECHRAFSGSPYQLAPAVAVLMLKEHEIELGARLDAACALHAAAPSSVLSDLSSMVA